MNRSTSTYCQIYENTTYNGAISSLPFTGKEKDPESGYHYFGARYYDSEALSGWLSVDPMSDKYPSMSPYNYCAWNPIKLVDPDGREIIISGKTNISYSIGMSADGLSGFQKKSLNHLIRLHKLVSGKNYLRICVILKTSFI